MFTRLNTEKQPLCAAEAARMQLHSGYDVVLADSEASHRNCRIGSNRNFLTLVPRFWSHGCFEVIGN